jgi:hypothetical protein
VGALTALNGYKIGWSAMGRFHPMSFQASVWNQTLAQPIFAISGETFSMLESFNQLDPSWVNEVILSTDYHNRVFKLGYGASLSFVPSEYDEMGSAFTASFLVTPFNQPLVIATLGALSPDSESSGTSVGLSTYNYFSSYQANYLAYWKNLAVNLGIEYNHLSLQVQRLYGSLSYPGSLIFQNEPVAVSYNAMVSYVFSQDRECYKIDSLSGYLSRKPLGLTVGCGFASKTQKDVFALLSSIGQDDWLSSVYPSVSGAGRLENTLSTAGGGYEQSYSLISVDNTISSGSAAPYASLGNLNAQGEPEHAFQIKSKSLTFIVNYQIHSNIEWKNELTYTDHQKVIFGEDMVSALNSNSAYVNSLNWYKTATFQTQLSVMF